MSCASLMDDVMWRIAITTIADYVQLTNHIQHQLAEAGRDANPISAMFDSLAHPQLDTHRGEYPTFLKWRQSTPLHSSTTISSIVLDSPPPTPIINQNQLATPTEASTARPHIVLGRGDVGGIWADMGHDHNQTLSYNEHMELPLYSFADFIRDHPEHDKNLDRPLRSTVSAYYKAHVQQTGIQSNFSNYTAVTGIYHLKDMENHCCCGLDPLDFTRDKQAGSLKPHLHPRRHTQGAGPCQSCAPFRYVVVGHVDSPPIVDSATRQHSSRRIRFMIRAKTVVLATGTFDQPKKLPAAKADPCALPASPTAMIQQTFHDTRQLEEWMKRHDGSRIIPRGLTSVASPPPSPSSPSKPLTVTDSSSPSTPISELLPIVIVGTGLSAADAILLIHEKQPWRRVIHIYKHFSASEPSPLKRCHRDVYPEYNSIWMRMKRFATLKNSVQSYQHPKEGEQPCRIFGNVSQQQQQSNCEPCQQLLRAVKEQEDAQEQDGSNEFAPLCASCSYKGLPDASVASWDPVTGQVVLVLSHGVVIQEEVAAVGVFIGKQVHMGFLKGSLAQEMLSSPPSLSTLGNTPGVGLGPGGNGAGEGGRISLSGRRKRSSSQAAKERAVDIPTPPCTPPRSPILRPTGASVSTTTTTTRQQFWHKQAVESLRRCRTGSSSDASSGSDVKEGTKEDGSSQDEQQQQGDNNEQEQEEDEDEDEDEEQQTDPSQVLTLLKPLVSDMYNFRLIPTGIVEPVAVHQGGGTMVSSSSLSVLSPPGVSSGATAPITLLTPVPTFPTKTKKCTRLPCYPIRRPSPTPVDAAAATLPSPTSPSRNDNSHTTEITTATTIIRAATMGDEARTGNSLANAASRVGKSIRAMSSACISMPCSPLLGSRIVCPTLPTPPLLSLCTAAANVLTNSMSALTPRCSLISASGAGSVADMNSSKSISSASSSALSSRRTSRCSRSSSISSLALSTITSVDDGSSGAVAVAIAAAAAVGDETEVTTVAAGIDDADELTKGKGGTIVTAEENAIAAVIASGDSEMIEKEEEEERHNYSLHGQIDDVEMADREGCDPDESHAKSENEDEEEEDVTPYPPPATPAEKFLEPRMDHSIYAAGAITGSKFVRYVLGNGCAIVADILRSESV
ncbi:Oxidative stress-induced growth inhibitor 2 [Linnemannia exigua]|uniref:Oxidative stress-induced growth inhibitor 2 n=1 Tax=Linnemannia exigua TaxID=604196 RepID=A0AAD4DJV2_9FUNG|nr:Oxidative stress-induced growth inhibitor 2 [Linnemannia exigua]